jgi:hydrogenase expression/formation protein HypE
MQPTVPDRALTEAPREPCGYATRRSGVAQAPELAAGAGVAVILDEEALPVTPLVQGACDLLGIDPVYVACEGKFAAVAPAEEADAALAALRAHPLGRDACVVGEIRDDPAGVVALRNAFGGTRIVDMLVGGPLPRIC